MRSSRLSRSIPGCSCRSRSLLVDLASSPGTRISATAASGVVEAIGESDHLADASHRRSRTSSGRPGPCCRYATSADLARQHELMVIVDGAQSAGQVPVDLHALWASTPTRWPVRSGSAVQKGPVCSTCVAIASPTSRPRTFATGSSSRAGISCPAEGAKRYEIGEFYSPGDCGSRSRAVAGCVTRLVSTGRYRPHRRPGADFRRRLTTIDGVSIVTPSESMARTGQLHDRGTGPAGSHRRSSTSAVTPSATSRPQPCTVSARASIGWWNTEEEVAGLAAAMADLASNGPDRNG